MPLLKTRWPLFGALVAGMLVLASFWAVVLSDRGGEAVPASGGRYVEGVVGAPERINPLFARNDTERDLSALLFSGLVRLAPDGTPLADLAERWEITGNGTGYVFHLRRGIAWHDDPASPFDADDVAYTYNAIGDPGFRGDPALAEVMRDVVVTARDADTVEFQLEQAYAPFLAHLTVGILPEHLLRGLDADALYNAPFNAQPVGTGPYRFKGYTREGVVLEANSTYHFGPPHISTLEVRVYSNSDGVEEALREGNVDGALLPVDALAADVEFLRDRGLAMHELTSTSLHVVYFDTRSPLFSDATVRRAIIGSVNAEAAVEASGGAGETAPTGINPQSWAYAPVEGIAFDPGAAATALERAGWSRGRDGVRSKDGVRLSFTLSTSNEPQRVAIAEDVARQVRALGAEVDVQALDTSAFIEQYVLPRRFEAALVEIDPGPDPDPYPFWHSTQIAPPGGNLASFSDPQMDDVLERARQTTDTERRKELYELYAGYIVKNAPALLLFAPARIYAQDARVQGFAPTMLFAPPWRFANVHEWFVRTRVE